MKKERRTHDHYPTPPDVVEALRLTLPKYLLGGPWLDPAAGSGGLLTFLGLDKALCHAIELRVGERERLEGVCDQVVIGDALDGTPWPPGHIICNPPFSHAGAFVRTIAATGRLAHVFTRTSFWQTRRSLSLPWPDLLMLLTWRPSFDGSGNTDYNDYCWCRFNSGAGESGFFFVARPVVSEQAWLHHATMLGLHPAPQGDLFDES